MKLAVAAFVGLPEMSPVVAFNVNPAGNLLPVASDHLYGAVPPVAVSDWEYFTLTVPPGRVAVVTVSGGGGMTVNAAVATALSAIFFLKAWALSVTELVSVMAVRE